MPGTSDSARAGEDHLALASFVQIVELGYLLYGMCGCDARTFCLEFSVPAEDTALHVLHEEAAFMAAACSMTDAPPWLAPGRYDPIGPIAPMGQERNLLRHFVREGLPLALGLHVLGAALAFSRAMQHTAGSRCTGHPL